MKFNLAEDSSKLGRWWAIGAPPLPHAIKYKANYTMYPAELAEYEAMLAELVTLADKERLRVRRQIKLMESGHTLWNETPLPPYTLGNAMRFMVNKATITKTIMEFFTTMALRRKELFNSLGDENVGIETKLQDS